MKVYLKLLTAVAAGLLASLSFNQNLWYLAIVAFVAPLSQLSDPSVRYRMAYAFLFAEAWFLSHIQWIDVLGSDAWIALATLCALPWLLFGWIRVPRIGPLSVLIPTCAVITIEGIRSIVPWGGFPWGLIAYSQLDGPFVELSRFGGSSLVSGVVVATSATILWCYRSRDFKLLLFPIALGVAALTIPSSPTGKDMQVAGIQGNVPRTGLDLASQRAAVLSNHVSQTTKLLSAVSDGKQPKPDLIVWPESSTDIDPIPAGAVHDQIDSLVDAGQTPLLVGATTWSPQSDVPRNSGILWVPEQGPVSQYAKNHLVPFGEYIPMRAFLTKYIERLELVPVDYEAGDKPGIFQIGNFTIGDVICFEVAYGKQIRETIALGSQLIVVQTNNATYGNTNQPEQQFAITRFRAIEHQRPFLVASTSGVSGLIDHNGNVLQRTEQFEAATVSGRVATVTELSITDRVPMWSALIGVVGFITFLILEIVRPKRVKLELSNRIKQ